MKKVFDTEMLSTEMFDYITLHWIQCTFKFFHDGFTGWWARTSYCVSHHGILHRCRVFVDVNGFVNSDPLLLFRENSRLSVTNSYFKVWQLLNVKIVLQKQPVV